MKARIGQARVVRDDGSCLKEKMSENPIRDLVKFVEESMPIIEKVLRGKLQAGYDARMQGKPRIIHQARRNGAWKRGWDNADQVLEKQKKKRVDETKKGNDVE